MLQPTEDERFVVDAVGRFVRARVEPEQAAWDRAGALPEDIGPALAELGLTGLLLDEARGGTGFGLDVAAAAVRTLARGDASLAWFVASHNLALRVAGSEVDPADYAAGRAFMTSTPPVSPETPDREVAALFGAPTHVARWRPDMIRLEPFDAAALTPFEPRLGLRAAAFGALPTPDPGSGASDAAGAPARDPDRDRADALVLAAAIALGVGEAALSDALAYAGERQQFGRPLTDFQGLQFRLADRATELEAAGALLRWAVQAPDLGRSRRAAGLALRAARATANDAVQIFGGVGFVREYPVEKRLRDAQALAAYVLRPSRLEAEIVSSSGAAFG